MNGGESAGPPEPLRPREPLVTREVGWAGIALFVASTAALLVLVPLLRESDSGHWLAGPAWWENLNLFAALLLATIALLFGLYRLRAADVGLNLAKLGEGVVALVLVYAAMQAWPYVASGSAELARTWSDPGLAATLRWAAVMFLATALWEEIAFRGFLLPQLYLKSPGGHRLRIWLALFGSQLVFASAHIPAHVAIRHLAGMDLVQMVALQAVAGLLLGLLYLRTRNLWLVIGIHGLANAPTPLAGGALGWEIPVLVLILAWPFLLRRKRQRGFAAIVAER